jgi:hypothetical protein
MMCTCAGEGGNRVKSLLIFDLTFVDGEIHAPTALLPEKIGHDIRCIEDWEDV